MKRLLWVALLLSSSAIPQGLGPGPGLGPFGGVNPLAKDLQTDAGVLIQTDANVQIQVDH